jgi:L-ribulokinase
MTTKNAVIGLDYGTDSVRALIVDAADGREIAQHVHPYSRWAQGRFCDAGANQFRQHPLDYVEGLELAITRALAKAPKGTAACVRAISVDTTGSTPVAVDKAGTPLSLLPAFKSDPDAMFILWKDHTGVDEAAEINDLAHSWGGVDYTMYCGGVYSSEWYWSKILHTIRTNEKVRSGAFSWVEHCDWIPALLTGDTNPLTLKRSRCASGHKALWHRSWDGLPAERFLTKLDRRLAGVRDNLFTETFTADRPIGALSLPWAQRLGLSTDVLVGVGAFDAHMGAVGGGITAGVLSKVMGTSTCDMMVAPLPRGKEKLIKGICGQVDGSIIPGMLGMEAGQSAFGDAYAWFRRLLCWPVDALVKDAKVAESVHDRLLVELSQRAARLPIGGTGIVALDWLNGRRTPNANQALTGAIMGLNLGSDAPAIYRALVESTAFGARKIVDCFTSQGVKIHEVVALGGIAKKSPFVMQVVADVFGMPIKAAKSDQACALGAAMFAATVAGIHVDVLHAQQAMSSGFEREFRPIAANVKKYAGIYERYSRLGEFVEGATER